jgi:hypothetical protein
VPKEAWGSKLSWRLRAFKSRAGSGKALSTSTVSTVVGKTALTAGKPAAKQVALSWKPVLGSKGYGVFQCDGKGKNCKQVASVADEQGVSCTVKKLKAKTAYVFKVAPARKYSAKKASSFVTVAGKSKGKVVYSNEVKVKTAAK